MKTAIALTTIHVPHLLEEYAENFKKYNHEDVGFIVIGDLKTPPETEMLIKNVSMFVTRL